MILHTGHGGGRDREEEIQFDGRSELEEEGEEVGGTQDHVHHHFV